MSIGTVDISKKYKFKTEDDCLMKIVDILQELSKLETWALRRGNKKQKTY